MNIKSWLEKMLFSALQTGGSDAVSKSSLEEWQREVVSATHIYYRYSSAVTISAPEHETLTFDEVLVPLASEHWPEFILVRHKDQVFRLAHYDMWTLQQVIIIADLPSLRLSPRPNSNCDD